MMKGFVLAAVLGLAATAVVAQSNPIGERRAIMKQVGSATQTGARFVKGELPFDLAKAKEILDVYALAADKTHTYYPVGSETGGETTASPKIWESQADFRAKFDAWAKDIQKAKAETKDLETFRANFTTLTRSCGGCHQSYRIKT